MTADLTFLVAGLALLLAVVLPELLSRWALSAPIVLVGVGLLIGLTPLPDGMPLDPQENRAVIEHVTELTVIVALMGVGLALDRPLRLRDRTTWAAWSPTWRLLAVAMPLCVAAVALLGWAFGLAPAAALLLGAVLAPTDPVLASDVQVTGPADGRGRRRGGRRRPLLPDVRGRAQRRARLPVRDGCRPAGDRGRVLGMVGRVGVLVRRRQGRHRAARRRGRGLGAGPGGLPVAAATPSGWPSGASRCWRSRLSSRRTGWASWPAATGSSRSSCAR